MVQLSNHWNKSIWLSLSDTCSYYCIPHCMCTCGYDTSECIMRAVAYVKLYAAVLHIGYCCHVAYNTILSQKNAAGMIMCLLATYLPSGFMHYLRGLCKGTVIGN